LLKRNAIFRNSSGERRQSGIVTDSSGAALANATLRVEDPATGLTRSTHTGGSGDYQVGELPVGTYALTVSMPGFEVKKIENIDIAVAKTTNFNVTLGVATQQAALEVNASAAPLETSSSAPVADVDDKSVEEMHERPGLYADGQAGARIDPDRRLARCNADERKEFPDRRRGQQRRIFQPQSPSIRAALPDLRARFCRSKPSISSPQRPMPAVRRQDDRAESRALAAAVFYELQAGR
jgi:hypothetical protein